MFYHYLLRIDYHVKSNKLGEAGNMKVSVGIDLGTTFCAVAIINKNGEAEIIPNSEGEKTTPSIIKITDEGFVFGIDAKDDFRAGDLDCAAFFKRSMGDDGKFRYDENDPESPKKRGRGTNKSKVIVAVSLTEDGKPLYARMQVVDNFKAATIEKFAHAHIEKGAKIITDGFKAYKSQKVTRSYFVEYVMLPAADEGSKLKWLHTVVSNAKAFVLGTFHGLKADDLQLYLDEFCYRFNRRNIPYLMFDKLIDSAINTPSVAYYHAENENL